LRESCAQRDCASGSGNQHLCESGLFHVCPLVLLNGYSVVFQSDSAAPEFIHHWFEASASLGCILADSAGVLVRW
jgi:hypothetical protein